MVANSRQTCFAPVRLSLRDMLGAEYVEASAGAASFLTGMDLQELHALAAAEVDFLPAAFQQQQQALLAKVGQQVTGPAAVTAAGATTEKFLAATRKAMAPVSASGMYRIGEDGRLYLITKAEHYHVSLGHSFPGFGLIDHARRLGVPNATHNNTRGHITRLLEQHLIAAANGLPLDAPAALTSILDSKAPGALNRVLNLETGSLALEAAIKIALGRFYRVQPDSPAPPYEGRTPVMLVLADAQGDATANYHGTTLLAQTMRGMWPALRDAAERQGVYRVRAIRPNDLADLDRVFAECDADNQKIAAFFIELILMNYGALTLRPDFVQRMASLCKQHGVPLVIDEIQTGLWSPQLLMFREYGLNPSIVGLGKGFPGGEYAASRLIFTAGLDVLPQFGALVTNGQEELASLAYLISMRWATENATVTSAVGEYFEMRMRELAQNHSASIDRIEGRRQLLGIHFCDLPSARAFTRAAEAEGIDISVQTYKTSVTPAALTKLPLIATYATVDLVLQKLERALRAVEAVAVS